MNLFSNGKRSRAVAWAAAATLGVAALAGCGGAAQPASSPSHAAASSASGQKLIPITIGKAVDVVSFTTADVAKEEGFFKQQGIDAKILVMQGSSNANAALVGGSVQFTMADSIPLAIARGKGVPLIAVEGIDHGDSEQLIVSNKWIAAHHLSPTQPLNQRIAGLQGMTFAAVGPTDLKLLQMLFQQFGVPFSSVKVESLQSGSAAAVALAHGQIDAFQISPPTSFEVVDQGAGTDLINYETVPGQGNIEYDLVMTTTQYAQAHPDIVRKVATAFAEANNFMIAHPDKALQIEEKLFPKIPPSVLQKTLALIQWNKDGLQQASWWKDADTLINQLGVVKGTFTAKEGVDWTNQYIDLNAVRQQSSQ